jgi:hypothetical protein
MPPTLNIVDGDLLDQDVQVIVNAWNRNIIPWWLLIPQGISGAIKKRGGHEPFRELARLGAIPLGGAVLTGAAERGRKRQLHRPRCAGSLRSWRLVRHHPWRPQLNASTLAECSIGNRSNRPFRGLDLGWYLFGSPGSNFGRRLAHHRKSTQIPTALASWMYGRWVSRVG